MSDERRQGAKDASDLFTSVFRGVFAEQAQWTDEQWAKHDAELEAQERARDEEARLASEKRILAEKESHFKEWFPARALEAAKVADETAASIQTIARWEWSLENQGICVLSGPPGVGKTVAVTWWAWKHTKKCRFLRSTSFASSSRYDREQREEWFHSGALILDDLGSEYADAKGNFLVDLDELVDVFYGDKRTLLITTNLTAEDFKTRYGERVTDRLRECGTWLSVKGTSLRRKL